MPHPALSQAIGRAVKIYAERPFRAAAQVLGDLLLIGWVGAWIRLGLLVHDQLDALRLPAARVGRASAELGDALAGTSDQLRGLQFVGDLLAAPFDAIVNGARELTTASGSSEATIARLADLSILWVALFPILFAAAVWLALRGRWIRKATAAAKLRDSGTGDMLLAAQALTTGRLDQLARVVTVDDPLADETTRRRMAAFQLRQLGLRSYDPDD